LNGVPSCGQLRLCRNGYRATEHALVMGAAMARD
jgi:hypothetical protein